MYFFLKTIITSWFRKEIYLDHASTTPLDPRVFFVMRNVFKNAYRNRGGWYQSAEFTDHVIRDSRSIIAKIFSTTAEHVVFTRGGTESNNLAIMGTVANFRKKYPEITPHVITSAIEHDSVLQTCRHLESMGQITLSVVPCNAQGIIEIDAIKKELRPETVLITVMYANNEIGTIQPVREIAKLIRWYKKQLQEKNLGLFSQTYPLVHTDGIQAVNYCDIAMTRLGVDMMTVSGSKIYGPKSIGALIIKDKKNIDPILFGGGHEFGLRAGTEDSALIAGFSTALQLSDQYKETEIIRLQKLQEYFIARLEKDKRITINGGYGSPDPQQIRLPNNINISIKGISAEWLVIQLARCGFAVSAKSACQSDSNEESHVIMALRDAQIKKGIISDFDPADQGSIRITMGRNTTKRQIDKLLKILFRLI